MGGPEAMERREAEEFLHLEARLLDERRFEEWLALWTADGRLFVPGGDGDDPEVETAIIDDDRATLADRILRLRSPATYAQSPPSRTLRLVSNVEVQPAPDGGQIVWAAVVIYEARLTEQRALPARCRYHLVPAAAPGGAAWRIASKRVRLIGCDQALGNLTFLL